MTQKEERKTEKKRLFQTEINKISITQALESRSLTENMTVVSQYGRSVMIEILMVDTLNVVYITSCDKSNMRTIRHIDFTFPRGPTEAIGTAPHC